MRSCFHSTHSRLFEILISFALAPTRRCREEKRKGEQLQCNVKLCWPSWDVSYVVMTVESICSSILTPHAETKRTFAGAVRSVFLLKPLSTSDYPVHLTYSPFKALKEGESCRKYKIQNRIISEFVRISPWFSVILFYSLFIQNFIFCFFHEIRLLLKYILLLTVWCWTREGTICV